MFQNKEYVYMVYKEKSFSRAAKKMYVTQPCLSAMVKKVETRLGTPIFNRNVNPVQLTDSGKVYMEYVLQVMKLEEQLEKYLCDVRGLKQGSVSIGTNNVSSSFVLPEVIRRFSEHYPDIQIQLYEGNVTYLEEQLHNGLLDMVLDNYPVDEKTMESVPLRREQLLIALPIQWSSEVGQMPISLKNFRKFPFVVLRRGNDTRNRFDQLCQEEGMEPSILMEVDQLSTAYNIASSGIAAALVSDTLVKNMPSTSEKLRFYQLSSRQMERQLFFHYPRNKYVNLAMSRFIQEAVESQRP